MTDRPNSFQARDIACHIHSQTNLDVHESIGPTVMVRGDGVRVHDDGGREYIEAMAGLWSASLGFSERRLVEAARAQLERLPFYHSFAHRSTEPAIDLAEALIELAPVPMSKVLFQSSGSEANDTAIKLVWYYFHALGKPEKHKIVSRIGSYHGTSIGTASLTGLPHIHQDFRLPLDGFLHVTAPNHYRNALRGESEEDFSARLAQEVEDLILREGPETVAAFFAEPVMGVGGVIVPPAGYFARLQAVLDRHDVLLIADEVICGFGRTGNWWGSQTVGMRPDMITAAKALSASYAPISALMVSERIYDAMKAESRKIGTFGHGYTYGGHPVCATVALETLRIYKERDLVAHAAVAGAHLGRRLTALAGHPLVGQVRGCGLMWAVELVADKETRAPFPAALKVSLEVQNRAFAHGVIVRSLGNSVAFSPPLIIGEADLDIVADAVERALDETAAWLKTQNLATAA